jgi:hypothetical protein
MADTETKKKELEASFRRELKALFEKYSGDLWIDEDRNGSNGIVIEIESPEDSRLEDGKVFVKVEFPTRILPYDI